MTTLAAIDARFKPAHRTQNEISDAVEPFLAELRGYRATYLAVVERARTSSATLDVEVVIRALDKFDALEEELLEAQTDAARRNIVERAEEVEQGRAYLQPEAELVVEANTLVADMTDWGVPPNVLAAISTDVVAVIKDANSTVEFKRAALNKLYAYYDAWSDHVANYERWAKRTAWTLSVFLVGSTLGCIYTITRALPLYGFMLAGITGALLSVLSKFPPMLGWGQWASYTPRTLGRIATGVVTTLAGGALLALDVIQIGDWKFLELFAKPELKAMLLLVGFGVVFGFSERALVRFQDLVFKPDTAPTTAPSR